MSRLYILINVRSGTAEQVAQCLQSRAGVLSADIVEGPPDIVMLVQAGDYQTLAELTIKALTPVEGMIEGLQLLPARCTRDSLITSLAYRKN